MVLQEPMIFKEYLQPASWIEGPPPGSSSGSSTDMGPSSSSSSPSPLSRTCKPQPRLFGHGTIPELETFEGVSYVKNQQLGGFRATQLLALTHPVLSGRRKRRARRLFLQATFGNAPVGGIVSAQDVASAHDRVALMEQDHGPVQESEQEKKKRIKKPKPCNDSGRRFGVLSDYSQGVVDNLLSISKGQETDNVQSKVALVEKGSTRTNRNTSGSRKLVTFAVEKNPKEEDEEAIVILEESGVPENTLGASTGESVVSQTPSATAVTSPPLPLRNSNSNSISTSTSTTTALAPKRFTLALQTGPNNSTFWIGSVNEFSRKSSFSTGNDGDDSGSGNGGGENGSPVLIPVPVTSTGSGGGGSSNTTSASNSLRESLKFSYPRSTSISTTDTSPTLPISFFGGKKNVGTVSGSSTSSGGGGTLASLFGKPNRNRGSTTAAAAARKAGGTEAVSGNDNGGAGSRAMSLEVNNMMLVMSGKAGVDKPWKPLGASLEDLFFPKRYRRRGSKDSISSGSSSLTNIRVPTNEEGGEEGGTNNEGGSSSKEEDGLAEVEEEDEEEEAQADGEADDTDTDTNLKLQSIEHKPLKHFGEKSAESEKKSKKLRDNGFYLFPLSGVYSEMPWLNVLHTKVSNDLTERYKSPDGFLLGTQQVPEQEKLVMILNEEDLDYLTNVETTTELLIHRTDFFQDTRDVTPNSFGSPQTYGQQWLREWQRVRGMPQEQAEEMFALYMRETYLEVREDLMRKAELRQEMEMKYEAEQKRYLRTKKQEIRLRTGESHNVEIKKKKRPVNYSAATGHGHKNRTSYET
ncbi:uncharacterized protein SAPINGB_P001969 [Magnusiomyces paraingens]|uniref:Uncharacterized protein n=1 Tax=Magnusiomyces paraingens TaxID=2606893 RepID=A0A5E8BC32_9ASCO|nr:uncharacterized protein SAPINGB_P001969 [Saprochaete ingens]VVT48823.1 unnamed protein product [Saprochaete ingens]